MKYCDDSINTMSLSMRARRPGRRRDAYSSNSKPGRSTTSAKPRIGLRALQDNMHTWEATCDMLVAWGLDSTGGAEGSLCYFGGGRRELKIAWPSWRASRSFYFLLAKEEKHQSEVRKTGVLLMQLKKMHDPALFGGVPLPAQCGQTLSLTVLRQPTPKKKRRR